MTMKWICLQDDFSGAHALMADRVIDLPSDILAIQIRKTVFSFF